MIDHVRFGILGPPQAWCQDRQLDLGPGKQRAVLAVLLLNPGRPVTTTQLVEAVWPEDPPANGANVVQKYVAGLRRALEPDRSPRTPGRLLASTDAGYVLRIKAEQVDAGRFEQHVRRANAERAAGRLAEAADELTGALECWQGEPLSGLVGPYFETERARLTEARATGLETRAEITLQLGQHVEQVSELVRLVADFPLRERLRYLLMLALYRCDRQAEALGAYRDFAALLRDDHGLEPGRVLQELHQAILRSDPILAAPASSLPENPSGALSPWSATVTPSSPVVPVVPLVTVVDGTLAEDVLTGPRSGGRVVAGPTPAGQGPVGPSSAGPRSAGQAPSGETPPNRSGTPFPPAQPAPAPYAAAAPGTLPPPVAALPANWTVYDPELAASGSHERGRWVTHTATTVSLLAVVGTAGFATCLVVAAYAIRRRSMRLAAVAVAYLAACVTFMWLIDDTAPDGLGRYGTEATILLMSFWLGGTIQVVLMNGVISAAVFRRPFGNDARGTLEKRIRREQARQLVRHYPPARSVLRIGRPDLPREYDDGGLVDINSVSDHVIAVLRGLDVEQRRRLALDRWYGGPYASLEELVTRCRFPSRVVQPLREILIFLPVEAVTPPVGSDRAHFNGWHSR